jgi:uncharacterized protein YdeI (YjbR/CyaY-like superfamily)
MSKVAEYIEKNKKWAEGLSIIRSIILTTELEENIKWGAPVYSLNGKNVMGLGAFKNHFGIWFFQGVFIEDKAKQLENAQEGKTKALRQWRFKTIDDIDKESIKHYTLEAIENQRLGKEIKPERNKTFEIPEELKLELSIDKDFNIAFEKLSKSKQREYADHISSAKREATKKSRLEKIIPMILDGVGLHDKYKNC